jgi:aminoglycoside phosphotransferase (APT) family kinase protein
MAGRVRHPIDKQALEVYIIKNVPEIQIPLELKQFGFGQSNPTYQLTASDGKRYVLRKKPPGNLLSKAAHQVEREHRIISALEATDVPVPRAICLCEDGGVVGTPFYIMEFLDGRIIEDLAVPGVAPRERLSIWRAAVYTLAKFHQVDYKKVKLESFGKPTGFYDRQIATWRHICHAQEAAVDVDTQKPVGRIPHFDELLRFLSTKSLQPKERSSLVHGDFKLDNIVFHKTEARVIGVLDWEMSTVGHPLSDLANMLIPFYTATAGTKFFSNKAFAPGATPGLPTPELIMGWYKEVAGWDPRPEINWAMAFAVFRSAAICQGIAARVATRQASSEKAADYADGFYPLGEFAWSLASKEMGESGVVTKL